MPLTQKQCFDVAITIVKQHQKEKLLSAFQTILEQQFPDCKHRLYNVNSPEFSEKTFPQKGLISECIESRKTFFWAEERYFIFPVISLGRATHAFTLQGDSLSKRLSLLEQLMTLFNNQQLLLDNSNHDPLTGLLNRQAFEERITRAIDMRRRRDKEESPACCFALLDIDFFKRVNDNFGHLYGDEVLILFANMMETTFRHDDMLFRYGGEEFAVMLKNIDLETATMVLDRFRNNIAEYHFSQAGKITVSIGVTEITDDIIREQVIQRSDKALYFSKENGRNQVNSFENLLSTGKIIDDDTHIGDIELF